VFVLYDNEKTGIVTKKFDASSQRGLGINGEFIGVIENNAFEQCNVIALNVRFCEIFQFVPNKFNAFSVRTIHKHYVGFDAVAVSIVNTMDEIANNGSFSAAGRAVKNNIGNFADLNKIIEF